MSYCEKKERERIDPHPIHQLRKIRLEFRPVDLFWIVCQNINAPFFKKL